MSTLGWIISSSLLMSAIALVGSITLVLKPETLARLLLPLVAFAAGSPIGGPKIFPRMWCIHHSGCCQAG